MSMKACCEGLADRPCPVCACERSTWHRRARALGLRRCLECSMVYVDSGGATETLAEDAEREYFGDGYLRKRDPYTDWFHRNKARRRIALLRRYVRQGRLLEIGVGGGELLSEARSRGYAVAGVDVSPQLAEHVRSRHGIEVYCCNIAEFAPSGQFDVVVMSHVIEHVVDPMTMLEHARRLLAPGGVLYLATPNVACWEARFDGWASYEPYHLLYFAPGTLELTLNRAGFSVAEMRTDEPLSAWLNTAVRGVLRERYSAARRAVQEDSAGTHRGKYLTASAVLNSARIGSGIALTPVRLLQKQLLRGDELVCIARPNT